MLAYFNIRVPGAHVFLAAALLLLMMMNATCNGPTYPAREVQVVTTATHGALYFPMDHGSAENPTGDCNICHGGFESFKGFTCLECHAHDEATTNSAHGTLTGYSYVSDACYACHPTGAGALGRDEHTIKYFPITSESAHGSTDCAGCHTTGTYEVVSCLDCHAHLQPDMNAEHQGISDYQYATPSCIGCHPTGSASDASISREDHTVKYFPINAQTAHGSTDCAGCHTTGSYEVVSCLDCHAHLQPDMNAEHQGISDYQYATPSCIGCHPTGSASDASISREDHTVKYFPINAQTAHGSTDCAGCHTTGSYEVVSCLDCHAHLQPDMNAEHQGISDYQYATPSCIGCHPNGAASDASISREDHTVKYFPINAQTAHGSTDCAGCHTTGTYDVVSCLDCHAHLQPDMNEEHQGISDYLYATSSCIACHPNGSSSDSLLSREDHTLRYFPINAQTAHGSTDCTGCHTTGTYEVVTCLDCHAHLQPDMNAEHLGISDYQYATPSCIGCHPNGAASDATISREDHTTKYFPINAQTAHGSTDCAGCHTTGTYEVVSCLDCHAHLQPDMNAEHQGISDYQYTTPSCIGCHPNGAASDATISREDHTLKYFPINAQTAHGSTDCAGCHTTGSYEVVTCLDCHAHLQPDMNAEHSDVAGYVYATPSCISCHPTGVALDRADHVAFPVNTGSKHATVGCSDCHTTSDYKAFTCVDCHTHDPSPMNGAHDDVQGYAYASSSCYGCHPDSIVLTRSEHQPWFPITSGDHARYGCGDCHKTSGTYQTFTCIGCHEGEHTCQRMNDKHQGEVRNYTCADSACLSCHPTGRE